MAVTMLAPLCGTDKVHAVPDNSVRMKKGETKTAAMRRTKKGRLQGLVEGAADPPVEEEAAEIVMSVIMASAVTQEEMIGEMRQEQSKTNWTGSTLCSG